MAEARTAAVKHKTKLKNIYKSTFLVPLQDVAYQQLCRISQHFCHITNLVVGHWKYFNKAFSTLRNLCKMSSKASEIFASAGFGWQQQQQQQQQKEL